MLPNLPSARLTLDPEGRVVGANDTAQLVLDHSLEQLRGRAATEVGVPCRDGPEDEALVVIDGYHGFMARPTDLGDVAARAFGTEADPDPTAVAV